MYVDHNVLQLDDKNIDDHAYLRSVRARYGVLYSRPGNGISHYVHLERFADPAAVLVGADSHTTMAGAVGMLAIGAGGPTSRSRWRADGYALERPRVVGVELRGGLRLGAGEGRHPRAAAPARRARRPRPRLRVHRRRRRDAPATERGTICNMIVETGATTGGLPDRRAGREWLAAQGREDDFVALAADPGAAYDETEAIDLAELEPLIARPPSPGNVVPVREVAGTAVAPGVRRLVGELVLRGPGDRRRGAARADVPRRSS